VEFWRCNRCEGILISEGNWNGMIGAPTLKAHREDMVESGNEAESNLALVLRVLTGTGRRRRLAPQTANGERVGLVVTLSLCYKVAIRRVGLGR
jgi:hypothetical protein